MTNLLEPRANYRPFEYPWAFEAYKLQQKMHWMPDEVPMSKDIQDWKHKLTTEEKNLLTQIFRFFTQGDIDVASGYLHKYIPIFGHKPEISMMLATFAGMEAVHIDAYSTLIDTLGLPETEYLAFNKYKAMVDKHEYLQEDFSEGDPRKKIALNLACYSAFTEGLQLFSSFAILLNFPRHGKMNGMGKIVEWSIKDESLHVESMIKLFRTFIQENPDIWTDAFKKKIYQTARDMVALEDSFIDLAFEQGGIQGLTSEEVKQYIRYIADRRLLELGLKTHFKVKVNPLPWIEDILNLPTHANFFETPSTEYAKGSTEGDWDEVF